MLWICGNPACNGRQFKSKYDRNDHVANMHRPRKFKCTLMGKYGKPCTHTFYKKSKLDQHIRVAHSTEKNFQCPECGRGFALKTGLTAHLKTHERRRQKEQQLDAEKDILGVKIDPTSKPSEEVTRLRNVEMQRRATASLHTSLVFDPMMKVAIKAWNDAMFGKQKTTIQSIPDYRTYICLSQIPTTQAFTQSSNSVCGTTTC